MGLIQSLARCNMEIISEKLHKKSSYESIVNYIDNSFSWLLDSSILDDEGNSILFQCLYDTKILKYMVEQPWVDIQAVDNLGRNILFYLKKHKDINHFIKKGVDAKCIDNNGENLLFFKRPTQQLLNTGIDINKINKKGETYVKGKHSLAELKLLVKNGYNFHYVDRKGYDIAYYYIKSKSPHAKDVIPYLFDKGVNSIYITKYVMKLYSNAYDFLLFPERIKNVACVVKDMLKIKIPNKDKSFDLLFYLEGDRLKKVLPLFGITNTKDINEVSDLSGNDLLKIFGRRYVTYSICLDNIESFNETMTAECCKGYFGIHKGCYNNRINCLICTKRTPKFIDV